MDYKVYKRVGLLIVACSIIILSFFVSKPAINADPKCIVSEPGISTNITCQVTQASPTQIELDGIPGNIYGWEHDKLTCQRPGNAFTCNLTANHGELRVDYGVNNQESQAIIQVFN
jgi:hypothetical protein